MEHVAGCHLATGSGVGAIIGAYIAASNFTSIPLQAVIASMYLTPIILPLLFFYGIPQPKLTPQATLSLTTTYVIQVSIPVSTNKKMSIIILIIEMEFEPPLTANDIATSDDDDDDECDHDRLNIR